MVQPAQIRDHRPFFSIQNLFCGELSYEAPSLHGNPLGDSSHRRALIAWPRSLGPQEKDNFRDCSDLPVILVLAGFTGNGPTSALSWRFGSPNAIEQLDNAIGKSEAPRALYVFVDDITSVGGSQFIDSPYVGQHAQAISKDLLRALNEIGLSTDAARTALVGGSSGGYGALQLGSLYPEKFGFIGAIASDSFFEASLLPELWSSCHEINSLGGVALAARQIGTPEFHRLKNSFKILNSVAMALCYSDEHAEGPRFPMDYVTGALVPEVWQTWLAKDPINFLPQRLEQVKKLKGIFIDCGSYDQYFLHYGSRQISRVLTEQGIAHSHTEFSGTHFDIGPRRLEFFRWLIQLGWPRA